MDQGDQRRLRQILPCLALGALLVAARPWLGEGSGPARASLVVCALAWAALSWRPQYPGFHSRVAVPLLAVLAMLPWLASQPALRLLGAACIVLLIGSMGMRRPAKTSPSAASQARAYAGALALVAIWLALGSMAAALASLVWQPPSPWGLYPLGIGVTVFAHARFVLRPSLS